MAHPITLIIGSEDFLVERAIATTKRDVLRKQPDLQITAIDAGGDDVAQLLMHAASPNLFGDATLIILRDIDQLDDAADAALRALISAPLDGTWLIATHPGGMKGKARLDALRQAGAEQIDAPALKGSKAFSEFLVGEFTRRKRKATSEALIALLDAIGQDVPLLASAVDQLTSDVDADPIGAADVRMAFAGVAEIASWTISDRVWERNAVAALTDLRQNMATGDASRIGPPTIAALARGLRNVVLVGMSPPGASDGDVARDVGVPPWQVKVLRRQWSGWSGDRRRAARAIVELADADAAMKGGIGGGVALDPEQKALALEHLVARLAARKTA